jgi:cold shock protein
MKGTIKTLTDRGFGFITPEGEGKDLFFHSSALVGVAFNELNVGDAVEFEAQPDPKNPDRTRAIDVKRA